MKNSDIITVNEENAGVRLDVFVALSADISRSMAQKLIDCGEVTVNGTEKPKNYALRINDAVSVSIPEPEPYEALPERIPLDIVYEDGDIIIVNKPSGMVVHPAAGNESGTLVNALLYHCGASLSGIGGVQRPGIVHRIDKETSGLIAVAKNDAAHTSLSAQLQTHEMHRVYRALTVGRIPEPTGTVNAPIGRDPRERKRMAVAVTGAAGAREAVTDYSVISRLTADEAPPYNEPFTLTECRLHTGRTHQIRVHMAYLHHPVAGDLVYGAGRTRFEKKHSALFDGQCLHAMSLTLRHPRTGEEMTFYAPLPDNFKSILALLREE